MYSSAEQLDDLIENNSGYCSMCDAITVDSGVEPDAENYRCPECGNDSVFGIEQALLLGYIE